MQYGLPYFYILALNLSAAEGLHFYYYIYIYNILICAMPFVFPEFIFKCLNKLAYMSIIK